MLTERLSSLAEESHNTQMKKLKDICDKEKKELKRQMDRRRTEKINQAKTKEKHLAEEEKIEINKSYVNEVVQNIKRLEETQTKRHEQLVEQHNGLLQEIQDQKPKLQGAIEAEFQEKFQCLPGEIEDFLQDRKTPEKKSRSLSASAPAATPLSSSSSSSSSSPRSALLCSSPSTAEHRPVFLPSLLQRQTQLAMDNSGKEKEAMQLMAEADKKVKASGSFLGGMFGGNHKVEDACEMYARAANMFKMAKNWSGSCGECVLSAARLHMQLQNKLDSATSFVDAGNAYKKADPQEIYESELVDIEKVAMSTMDNPLLKYNAKEYFFKASLCHFIVDELNAKLAIEKYEEMFPAFSDSRELKLLKKLLEAHEEQNSEAFTEAVKEFDSVSRLDQWLTTMLLRIKKTIQGDAGDLK
ncbi:hypothetical protein INR49_003084 [Caranx melampygus]|nr:hypothetical protein INR49_003084 [Caranx melampygus]